MNLMIFIVIHSILFENKTILIPTFLNVIGLVMCQKRFHNRETIAALNYEYIKCLSYPLPLYASQISNPFLDSRIIINHHKAKGLSAKGEILMKGIVFFLQTFKDFQKSVWNIFLSSV